MSTLKFTNSEYLQFSYALARWIEKEEYERLKTEEQYQKILEMQIQQSKVIEQREKEMRNKLKEMIS